MNMGTFNIVEQRANISVTRPMLWWSFVMAVGLVLVESGGSQHDTGLAVTAVATVSFGVWLGWQRRTGVIFFAPLVSWLFAWFPLLLAAIVRRGFFRGVLSGLFLDSVGWLFIGTLEFLSLFIVALAVRALRGTPREVDVIIDPPS
jgi:hypothetical protein